LAAIFDQLSTLF